MEGVDPAGLLAMFVALVGIAYFCFRKGWKHWKPHVKGNGG